MANRAVKKVLPYLQLMRLPALMTAWTDCFAGLVMTHSAFEPISEYVLLMLATTGLYLAGMVFNDVFDVEIDRRERPERPIPSGRVTLRNAIVSGVVLLAIGLGSAAAMGRNTLILAALLTACIFAYDAGLKKTLLGPFAMGGCRFLNVLMAASAIGHWNSIWTRPQLGLAAGIGIYIVGITFFARSEATTSRRGLLILGMLLCNAGVAVLIWLINVWPGAPGTEARVLIGLGAILVIQNRRWAQAVFQPEAKLVQAGVRSGLTALIFFDALMVYYKWGDPVWAIVTVAAVIPALLLGRWISMT
ncbi:MAG TPA: UbiA family prenyltransferase [Planctomycetaceae bacterium]|nr:UbiA family prenyltransferase [Planctomycetaceae bacterium]